jgi:membrane protease subunit (stomatin/prohibitin family)
MTGFMGVGMGINAMGNMMGGFSQMNQSAQGQQGTQPRTAAQAVAGSWTCACGNANTGKFCSNCGKPAPVKNEWTCECGAVNTGKFCSNCGKPAPAGEWTCECGTTNTGKFCSNCGKQR